MVISEDAVWVSNERLKAVHRIDPATNRVVANVYFPAAPCSGLSFGFGSIWVPLCGKKPSIARVDATTNTITALLPFGPSDSEGGITTSNDSVWIVTDKMGTLARIDPATNTIGQKTSVFPGSYNPLYSEGIIWITCVEGNLLTAVDAVSGKVLASIAVGPRPRFLTAGGGSLWSLNQGDGTVTRVDSQTKKVIATIAVGIPGTGGEICFGGGFLWATVLDIPLTLIDPKLNRVVRQWTGRGGDSVRFSHDSIWLTHLQGGRLWRIPSKEALESIRTKEGCF